MNQCGKIREQFNDRLDRRLDAAQTSFCDAHLASCQACRQEWETLTRMWDVIGKQRAIEPSFGFSQRTLRQLHETPPSFWHRPVLRWATVAALFAVVVGGGMFVRYHHEQTVLQLAAYQAAEQGRLEDFDVIACLDQLEVENQL